MKKITKNVVDTRLEGYKSLLQVWPWPFNKSVSATQIVDCCRNDSRLRDAVRAMTGTRHDRMLNVTEVGRSLRAFRSRICDGRQLREASRSAGVVTWEVVDIKPQVEQKSEPLVPPATCHKVDRVNEIPIEVHTDPGEIVIDLFAGSMSASVAARKLKRMWVAVERDAVEYEKSVKWLKENPA